MCKHVQKQPDFMIKMTNRLGTERNFLNLIKGYKEEPTDNTI